MKLTKLAKTTTILWLAYFPSGTAYAQEIILDRQVRAGDLILMPSISNPNEYRYIPDEAGLEERDDGTKVFSFLRYIEPNVTADSDNKEGAGGGVVHAVVKLQVDEETLDDARRELRRVNPQGEIVGPVTYSSGTFALVSSFAEAGSEFTDTVVGVGQAPVLEGGTAAVSLKLTKKGTQVLWESFNTAAPDISFSFNMDIEGYRSPKRAILEADFEKVYTHQAFNAGVATPYLQAEIEAAFEDLRNSGAIRLTQIGDDESLNALIQSAYERLRDVIFEPASSTGSTDFAALANANQESYLDKASTLLQQNRTEARQENDAIRRRNAERAERENAANEASEQAESSSRVATTNTAAAASSRARAERFRAMAQEYRRVAGETEDEEQRQRTLTSAQGLETLAQEAESEAEQYDGRAQEAERNRTQAQNTVEENEETEQSQGDYEETQSLPSLAIVASYKMKRVRQEGTYRIDLNKYTAGSISHRFDENIGDLRADLNNENIFRTVDLSQSAFQQREIPVYLDGLNIDDFGRYINFVTVSLRKRHENGDETIDEVIIDRQNFQQTANNFKLSYRRLGDNDNARFLNYDTRVTWSFVGDAQVVDDWETRNASGISLSPPLERRTLFVEGDPAILAEENVRSVDLKIYYKLGDREYSVANTYRIRSSDGVSSELHFMLPRGVYDYEYEASWRLRGGETRTTGRRSSQASTIYVDEVPGS